MIKVYNVNPIQKGDLLASCSVEIAPWKLRLHQVRVFKKGQNRWVSLPTEKYEVSGEIKYRDMIEFTDDSAKKRFRDQIMSAIDEYIEINGDMVAEDVIKEDAEYPF